MSTWTPRKKLIVAVAAQLHATRLEECKVFNGCRFKFNETARKYVHEMIEDRYSTWRQAGINQAERNYYECITDKAIERLITDILKIKGV